MEAMRSSAQKSQMLQSIFVPPDTILLAYFVRLRKWVGRELWKDTFRQNLEISPVTPTNR